MGKEDLNKDLLRAERSIGRILNCEELLPEQREELKRFDKHLKAEVKLTNTRRQYFVCLKQLGKFLEKDYKSATRDDIEGFFVKMNGKKESTVFSWKVNIRTFYKWLLGVREKGKYPDVVNYEVKKPSKVKIPKFLTEEEVKRMIEITDCIRDKCLLSVMYESGCRRGEIAAINIGDVIFDKEVPVARFTVRDQEGCKRGSRPIILVNSVPVLREYINQHPGRNEKDSPLFISFRRRGERLTTRGMNEVVKKYASQLDLEGIACHTFRHSRFRNLRQKGFSMLDMKQLGGWSQWDMVERYCRVADTKHIEDKMLEINGFKSSKEEKKEEKLKPKVCLLCGTHNDSTNRICTKCNMPLNRDDLVEREQVTGDLVRRVIKLLPVLEKLEKLDYSETLESTR